MKEIAHAPRIAESPLEMWVIFFNPADNPGVFVLRKFDGERPTCHMRIYQTLEAAREPVQRAGLTCVPRMEGDEPQIVEVWL